MASWIILFLAGLAEIVWVVGLKRADGFTVLLPSVVTLFAMGCSITLLGIAIRSLPIGVAYAVWTGIGVVGAAVAGMLLEAEPVSLARLFFIFLVVIGVGGLKLATPD
jgi:quaternary ammonium compound-resistance protein SugE